MLTLPQDLITDDISEEADLTLKEILGDQKGEKKRCPTFLQTSRKILTEFAGFHHRLDHPDPQAFHP